MVGFWGGFEGACVIDVDAEVCDEISLRFKEGDVRLSSPSEVSRL